MTISGGMSSTRVTRTSSVFLFPQVSVAVMRMRLLPERSGTFASNAPVGETCTRIPLTVTSEIPLASTALPEIGSISAEVVGGIGGLMTISGAVLSPPRLTMSSFFAGFLAMSVATMLMLFAPESRTTSALNAPVSKTRTFFSLTLTSAIPLEFVARPDTIIFLTFALTVKGELGG